MTDAEELIESVELGASMAQQCSALSKGDLVVLNVHLVGIDIFTGQKHQDLFSSTDNMDVPNATRTEYQLYDIDGGFLSLSTSDGGIKDDVELPDGELSEKIPTKFSGGKKLTVTVLSAMGEVAAIQYKEAS
eukprot:jgi/Phyca11/12506/fgenesh1_pm.PHYCAscaffold_329_\